MHFIPFRSALENKQKKAPCYGQRHVGPRRGLPHCVVLLVLEATIMLRVVPVLDRTAPGKLDRGKGRVSVRT